MTQTQPAGGARAASAVPASFDEVATTYDLMVGLSPGYHDQLRASADALLDAVLEARAGDDRTPLRLVDLGCGSGASTAALQAAVLLAKLPHLAGWSARRRENAAYYDAAFADLGDVRTPPIDAANESIYNQYTLRAERRDALYAYLKERGIGTSIYYPLPLHLQPCFAYLGYREGQCPESERAAGEVLSLPVFPELTRAQLDEVIGAVRGFYGR